MQSRAARQSSVSKKEFCNEHEQVANGGRTVALIAGTGGAFAQQELAQKPVTPIMGHNANLTFDTRENENANVRR